MFVIKYDKLSMVKLVQSIEKNPPIYSTTSHYTKEDQDTAWDNVARAVGEKDSLCRDKWHSIKSCYIRHLKYAALNSKRKPYYLAEYMDFLLPHVMDRIKLFLTSRNLHPDNLPSYLREALPAGGAVGFPNILQNKICRGIKEEVVDVEEVSDSEWFSMSSKDMQEPSTSKNGLKRLPSKKDTMTKSRPTKKVKRTDNYQIKTSSDDDIKFFQTISLDMALMSDHQKLKYKQEALSIIEDILYASVEVEDDEVNIID